MNREDGHAIEFPQGESDPFPGARARARFLHDFPQRVVQRAVAVEKTANGQQLATQTITQFGRGSGGKGHHQDAIRINRFFEEQA